MSRFHVVAARPVLLFMQVAVAFLLLSGSASAQLTGNIQGTVEDPSGAAIPQAKVALLNVATQASATTNTDASGGFRFLSLAPGSYKITVEAAGFANAEATVSLVTNQNLRAHSFKVGTASETVTVTSEDSAGQHDRDPKSDDARNGGAVHPAHGGRSMFSLVTVAPGVSGKGTTGGGSPGSGVDNFSTETEVDASANGQGRIANMWIVDGLDVTSAIRQGVLNLTPNPDVIQEASTRSTRSASNMDTRVDPVLHDHEVGPGSLPWPGERLLQLPGHVRQVLLARIRPRIQPIPQQQHFGDHRRAHHSNKQFFFFAAVEALRASASTGNQVLTFPTPEFAAWARTNYPNTFGTKILNTYTPTGATVSGVTSTAQNIFPGTAELRPRTTCPAPPR